MTRCYLGITIFDGLATGTHTLENHQHYGDCSRNLIDTPLDLSDSLMKVARRAVPRIADWCYIDLLEPEGPRERIAIYHQNPQKLEWGKELLRRYPPRAIEAGSRETVHTGQVILFERVTDEVLRQAAHNDEHLVELRRAGLCSGMIVPLMARRRLLGFMAVFTAESGRSFGPEDMQMAEEIAMGAALAIHNARLYSAACMLKVELEVRVEQRTCELKQTQQQYQALFEANSFPMFVLDRKAKRFLAVNDAATALYGFSREEMLAMSVADMRPPCGKKSFLGRVPGTQSAGLRLGVWQHQRRDGKLVQLEMAISQIAWNRGPALLVLAQDVTERRRAAESLRRANATLETIFNAAPVAIVAADMEGRVTTWNAAAERMFGWTAAEAIGSPDPTAPPEGLDDFHEMVRRVVATHAPQASLLRLQHRKSGERMIASISAAALRSVHGVATGYLAIIEDVTERERARAAIQDYTERLTRLSRQLLEAQEFERRRIARELHDEIGQSLSLLNLHLQQAQRSGVSERPEALAHVQAGIGRLLHDVRQLCFQLRPALLDDLGLLPALLAHVERFNEQQRVRCLLQHEGINGRRFSAAAETAVFRIVQEALTNVVRHADTDNVRVTIWADEELLQVRVMDQGRGFQLEQALNSGSSSGLAGMHERAQLAGANLKITTAPSAGACVTLEFPLRAPTTTETSLHVQAHHRSR
jgi:PAS domain S-box-containing protein